MSAIREVSEMNICRFGDNCGQHAIAACVCGRGVCSTHASGDPESAWQRHGKDCCTLGWVDPKDRPRLPDEWGYDYEQHRFMSPYMKRSLGVALLPFAVVALVVVAIEHGGLLGSLLALLLVLYATVAVCCILGWCVRRVCARLYYFWWPW